MLFSSPRFFVFLAALMGALALPLSVRRKKHILAVASCLFYAAWDYRYLALLLSVSVIDYACADRIEASQAPRIRRAFLAFSVVSNLSILAYFKYTNFLIDNINALSGAGLFHAHILLPAGISFYTFKSMSYTVDVYRREIRTCDSWLDYATFVTFFPELIAGPIVRASIFLPQLERPIGPSLQRFREGGSLFLLGLTKKLLVADRVATLVDPVFARPEIYSATTLWCAVFAYAIQIYADFSGYSDMAVGTARIVGYDLPENFRMPYASASVTEFWRRWHITLSSWLRDYLYVPLGGNRRGTSRTYLNLSLTMILGGLWHGASWNFVVWGALHGAALALHRMLSRAGRRPLPPVVARPITLVFIVLCWVPFRAPTFGITWTIARGLCGLGPGRVGFVSVTFWWTAALVATAHFLGAAVERAAGATAPNTRVDRILARFDAYLIRDSVSGWSVAFRSRTVVGAFIVAGWLLVLFYGSVLSNSPFIYFQF
jgi:alginate O-acetyltransferase complex protein AlgI